MNEQREESKTFFRLHKQDQKKKPIENFYLKNLDWDLRSFLFEFEFKRKQKTISTHPQPVVADYLGLKWLSFYSSFLFWSRKKNFQIFSFKTKLMAKPKPNEKSTRFPVVLLDLKLRFFLIWSDLHSFWVEIRVCKCKHTIKMCDFYKDKQMSTNFHFAKSEFWLPHHQTNQMKKKERFE